MTDKRRDGSRFEDTHAVGQTPLSAFATTHGKADEKITEKQAVVLRDLADRANEPYDGNLTRGQAEERIAALRAQLGED